MRLDFADFECSPRLAAILQGEENEVLREKVWSNILNALRKDIPDVDQLLSR